MYHTLLVKDAGKNDAGKLVTVALHRPEQQNSINALMLRELNDALDRAERSPVCHAFVMEGENGVFSTGMDFAETADGSASYMELLRRFSLSPRIVVAKLDGRVTGGGVGFAAASDLVVATPRTQFSLPEALWGLLPCCVLPWLIRRVGFQQAYKMALTTQNVSAEEARRCHLVDDLHDDPDEAVRRLLLRSSRVHEDTVRDLKRYARSLWIVSQAMEEAAVAEISRLLVEPRVRANISAFLEHRQFPWEKPHG